MENSPWNPFSISSLQNWKGNSPPSHQWKIPLSTFVFFLPPPQAAKPLKNSLLAASKKPIPPKSTSLSLSAAAPSLQLFFFLFPHPQCSCSLSTQSNQTKTPAPHWFSANLLKISLQRQPPDHHYPAAASEKHPTSGQPTPLQKSPLTENIRSS